MALTRYSIESVLFRRANPDGTPATPARNLGFTGTIDSDSAPFTTNAVDLTIKIDAGVEETQSIDFVANAPADTAAVTVAEAVIAINAAGFTDITASVDSGTGRLLIAYSGAGTPQYLQVYGEGADVFDFGQGQSLGGGNLGTKIIAHFNNAKGLTDALNLKDAEEVENEAGDGTLVTVWKSPKVKGANLVYTAIDQDNEFTHMIMGGSYNATTGEFIMPTVIQSRMPSITVEAYIPQYDKGFHKEGDTAGYTHKIFPIVAGSRGDEANEANALAEGIYNLTALQYNFGGTLNGHMSQEDITSEEYDAVDIENLAG